MRLEDKLAEIRAAGAKRIPEDKRAIMGAATQALHDSGILKHAIQVGDTLPAFALKNTNGVEVISEALLASGPLVLTVYRGHW